jgi:hypothetical protein
MCCYVEKYSYSSIRRVAVKYDLLDVVHLQRCYRDVISW